MIENYDMDEMFQTILNCDKVFTFLNQYFLEDTSDWLFREYMKNECEKGMTERQVLARYYASWIPWENCADKIIAKVYELANI